MIEPMALFPLYVTDDLEAQKRFYESSFGFEAVFFDATFYLHLHHASSGAQVGFMRPDLPNQPPFLHPRAGADGAVITVEVADARAARDEAGAMALGIAHEYVEEPWGQRHFMVSDSAGLVVDVVERQGPS